MASIDPLVARIDVEAGGDVSAVEHIADGLERIEQIQVPDNGLGELGAAAQSAAEEVGALADALDEVEGSPEAGDKGLPELGGAAAEAAGQVEDVAAALDDVEGAPEVGDKGFPELGDAAGDAANQIEGVAAALDEVDSSSLSDQLTSLGAGLLALEAGRQILDAVIDETAEAERTFTLLANAAEGAGNKTGLSLQQLQEMGAQIKKTFDQTAEEILGAETALLRFQAVGGQVFERATKDALDLATALGKSVPAAAELVGGALNNPIAKLRSLREVGISFTESQRQTIQVLVETGQTMKAQEIILQALEERFQGASERARNDFQGAMSNAAEAAGDLAEAIGAGGLSQALKDVSADFQAAARDGQVIGNLASDVGAAVGSLVSVVTTGFKVVVDVLGLAAGAIESQLGTILLVFGKLPEGLAGLAEKIGQVDLAKGLRDAAQPITDAAREMIAGADAQIKKSLGDMEADSSQGWSRLKTIWAGGAQQMKGTVAPVHDAAAEAGDAAAGMSERAKGFLQKFREVWAEALGGVQQDTIEKTRAIMAVFAEMDSGQVNLLPPEQKERLRAQFDEMIAIVRQAGGPITQEMANIGAALGRIVTPMDGIPKAVIGVTGALEPLGSNLEALGESAGRAGEAVAKGGGQISTAAGQIVAVGAPAAAAADKLAAGLDKLGQSGGAAAGPVAAAGGTITTAAGVVIQVGPSVQTAGEQIATGLDAAAGAFGQITDAAGGVQGAVGNAAGGVQTAAGAATSASADLQKSAQSAATAGGAIADAAATAAAGAADAASSASAATESASAEVVVTVAEMGARLAELEKQIAAVGNREIKLSITLGGDWEPALAKIANIPTVLAAALVPAQAIMADTKAKAEELKTALAQLDSQAAELLT